MIWPAHPIRKVAILALAGIGGVIGTTNLPLQTVFVAAALKLIWDAEWRT